MLDRQLFDHFRIYLDDVLYVGDDLYVLANGEEYLVRTVDDRALEQLNEQVNMANWLTSYSEHGVAQFIKPEGKKRTISIDGGEAVLFQLEKQQHRLAHSVTGEKVGAKLAKFHEKGLYYTPQQTKRSVSSGAIAWKERWERRLNQLENWYVRMRQESYKTPFDELFLVTFPYYIGLCENAIQMITDLMIDKEEHLSKGNTICHRRFHDCTWLTVREQEPSSIKVPTDFMYDHYTRDITEYVRSVWTNEQSPNSLQTIEAFLNDYESYHPLSLFDQTLLLARSMFPIHYFEEIETYYQTVHSEERNQLSERCTALLKNSAEYEKLFTYLTYRYPQLLESKHCPLWFQAYPVKHSSYG
ncbi:spore coat protein YutH [Bacillus shivajii]|uniref:spore coat putative kinase YutH n=1 Tax=Bacillus shivajii TaxID=1983719 RepID=UPI001CFA1BBE|nr:spore coat protein YutH [Bacillus shivajii]UCZ52542.1 spore coat protein YutH [Bacillus shivajii]